MTTPTPGRRRPAAEDGVRLCDWCAMHGGGLCPVCASDGDD